MANPASGSGLLGTGTPAAALLSLTRLPTPSVRRSDRRSCHGHGALDGDMTRTTLRPWSPVGSKFYGILTPRSSPPCAVSSRADPEQRTPTPLARVLAKSGPFGPSAAHGPTPGPHAGRPGQSQLKPRAAPGPIAHGTGSLAMAALSCPTPHPGTPPAHVPPACHARTHSNPPDPPEMTPPAAAEPPRCPHRSIGDFGEVNW